jgi:hypothetical protein
MKCWVLIAGLLLGCAFSQAAAEEKAEAPKVEAKQQQKRLALFLDGTWNEVESNTNVWRMKALCAPTSTDGKSQLAYYEVGVNGRHFILFSPSARGRPDDGALASLCLPASSTR